MKKKFYSLLVSGKLGIALISGLKIPNASALDVYDCVSQPFNITLASQSQAVNYTADTYGSSINIHIPGYGCTYSIPNQINLALSGVSPKDEVYIAISDSKDDPNYLSMSASKLRLAGNIQLLAYFSIIEEGNFPSIPGIQSNFSIDTLNSKACLIIPLNLPSDALNSMVGDEIYLQAVVFPQGDHSWDAAKVSDLITINIDVQDCNTPYPY